MTVATVVCSESTALLADTLVHTAGHSKQDGTSKSDWRGPKILATQSSFCNHSHVPHIKQLFSWDCGIACVLMILQAAGYHHVDFPMLRQLCPTTSVWTIDLAALLRRFGVPVALYTITLGINSEYAGESFYAEHMQEDERRVMQLFKEAPSHGISIQEASLSAQELQQLVLSGAYLVIVLADKRKLSPWLAAADMCLPGLCGLEIGYTGHYIILVGYDAKHREYIVRDPSSSCASLRVTEAQMEQARKAFGTDEDMLVVPVQQQGQQQGQPSCS